MEKAEPVQVHFTLCSRDQWSKDANARWMQSLHGFQHGIKWIMHVSWSLGLFSRTTHGGRPNTKPCDHYTPNAPNRWFILWYHALGPPTNGDSLKEHLVAGPGHMWLHTTLEGAWPHYIISEVCWDGGLWTHSFGLSQFHGPGSWLVCEAIIGENRQLVADEPVEFEN